MAENAPTGEDEFFPLEKLVEIPRGRKHVRVEPGLLQRLDFTKMRQTLEFELRDPLRASVKVKTVSKFDRVEVEMTMHSAATEWPDPSWKFLRLFYAALGVAVQQTIDQQPNRQSSYPFIRNHDGPIVVEYHFPTSIRGNELLGAMEDKLDRIRTRMPAILNIVVQGPRLGTSPPVDEDGEPFEEDEDTEPLNEDEG